jgi:hypothetical protein
MAKKANKKQQDNVVVATHALPSGLIHKAALKAAASAAAQVKFRCTSGLALVSLQLGALRTTFVSQGTMNLPSGVQRLTLQINAVSSASYTLSVESGATANPVNGTGSIGGVWTVTVP